MAKKPDDFHFVPLWPEVEPDHWCGEWEEDENLANRMIDGEFHREQIQI